MEYNEVKGNLLDMFDNGDFKIIAHGCNCFSTMGAGIAKQIANRYPQVYQEDVKDGRPPIGKLGDASLCQVGNEQLVFNLYTQYHPGPNLDYEALTLCLRKLNLSVSMLDEEDRDQVSLGLPLIGCGIAGGNWKIVKRIIKIELKDVPKVTIVHYDN